MSLKTKFFSFITAVVAVAAFASFSFAQDDKATQPAPDKAKTERGFHHGDHGQGDHMGGPGMRGMRMMRMFRDLNLTDAQKTQIKSIMDANKPDQATMEEMRTLREAKRSGTLTADQQARLDTLREQGQAKFKSVHEQILNVLTADQRAQLEAKKAEMKARREEWRQKRQQERQERQKTPAATTDTPKVN